MNKILCLLAFMATAVFCQSNAVPENPWFDHVKRPCKATHEELCALANSVRLALKNNATAKQIGELAPDDTSPRVVFITIGDDTWPGRTYYGTGLTFKIALEAAADFLKSNETEFAKETIKLAKATIDDAIKSGKIPPAEWKARMENPTKWDWLKLDVVQCTKPVSGFAVGNSRIALTSLVGFAFGPDMGFAFTPDQITGRCLISESGHIASQQVGNLISENYNWPALKIWMQLTAVDKGHRICLFETDSYYSDEQQSCRLYRGHQMQTSIPNAAQCRDHLQACATHVAAIISPDGKIRPPMPAWISTVREDEARAKKALSKKKLPELKSEQAIKYDETLDAKAELAIALARAARICGNDALNQAAIRAMFPVFQCTKPYGNGAAAVIEKENLPEDSMLSPDDAALIRTNALACLALMELKKNGKDIEGGIDSRISSLAAHIKLQFAGGCDFYVGRYWKNGKTMNDDMFGPFAQVEETALAALALSKYAELSGDEELSKKSSAILEDMLELKLIKLPIESLTLSPWFAEAICAIKRDDKNYTLALVKFATAINARSDNAPLYPDYYGAMRRYPSCTIAAEHTWVLAELSKKLRTMDKPFLAREQLTGAMPILLFQSQAFIDKAGSSLLPSPAAYVSFFRDNLEGFGFNLPGQVAQMMSLTGIVRELEESTDLDLKKVKDELAHVQASTDIHPGPLSVDLILTRNNDEDGDHRDLLGGLTQSQKQIKKSKNNGAVSQTKSRAKRN